MSNDIYIYTTQKYMYPFSVVIKTVMLYIYMHAYDLQDQW